MDSDGRKWIIVRIDGRIAAVSADYRLLSSISARLAHESPPKHDRISADTVSFDEIWNLRESTRWEDLMLFGTDFQKKVWRKLFDLTHGSAPRLICYSDFAELCNNRAGVRAVAHAIGLNPVSVIIPCHLVIPKESIDKIREINRRAQDTIFRGEDLSMKCILEDNSIDFGNYALGRKLKRKLISLELSSV